MERLIGLSVLLVVMAGLLSPAASANQPLYLAGLFPMGGKGRGSDIGPGVLPAVEIARRHVNKNKNILRGYDLQINWNDTQCDMAVGTKLFFDMMHNVPEKVMLFGDACSHVTAPIAESAKYWNIWQLSYADTNPILSDRTSYPNFFRTVPSDSDYNPARIQLLHKHQWKRVGTLFQDASKGSSRYAYAHSKLTELLDKEKIHRETESFSSDPKPALTNLKQKDIRIILGNFDHEMARKVFCSAHEQKMFGPKYVWIVPGDYPEDWWREEDGNISCSSDQLMEALHGYIGTDVMPLSRHRQKTISGLTPKQYLRQYKKRDKESYSKFHGYAYDGIWVIAKAIDTIIKQNGDRFDLDDFRGERLPAALNETNFLGVTGRVVFNNGDRVGTLVIKQFQKKNLVDIGEFDAHTNILNLSTGTNKIMWSGKQHPRDRTLQSWEVYRVSTTIYAVMCTIAGLGIVMTLSFLAINIKYRKHRYIKMSSPNMNNFIIIGCLFTYVSVFLLGTDGGMMSDWMFPYMCAIRTWVLCIGFTLSFGAMFSKTWRVHAIFTNIKLNRKVIKDYQLFMIVLVLLAVDMVVLITWAVLDPMVRDTKELPPEADASGNDIERITILEFCVSDDMMIYMITIYAYKGFLLMAGCFLAWETRQVTIPALNDSKYIGMSVYNIVIMCVSGVPVSFIIKDRPDAAYLIISLFIIFSTTVTLCLVFVPKVIELRRNPVGGEKRIRATLRKPSKREDSGSDLQQKIRLLSEENYRCRQILDEKKREIRDLLIQLGDDNVISDNVNRSPNKKTVTIRDNNFLSPVRPDALPCASDDDMSFVSTSSGANLWPMSTNVTTNGDGDNDKEDIELSSLRHIPPHYERRSDARLGLPGLRGEDHQGEEDLMDVDSPLVPNSNGSNPPSYDELYSQNRNRRFSPTARTPSYQGLKFLNDIFSLRETAILSDSEHERSNSPSIRSLPAAAKEEEAAVRKRFSAPPTSAIQENCVLFEMLGPLRSNSAEESELVCDVLTSRSPHEPADSFERLIDFKPVAGGRGKASRSQSPIRLRAKDIKHKVRGSHRRSDDQECLLPGVVNGTKTVEDGLALPVSNLTAPVKIDIIEYI